VLVIGDVARPVREDDHRGVIAALLGDGCLQHTREQLVDPWVDRARLGESRVQRRRQRRPGRERVGVARRGAKVVLEHQELARRVAYNVEADDRRGRSATGEAADQVGRLRSFRSTPASAVNASA
jgi:hypothetical protein